MTNFNLETLKAKFALYRVGSARGRQWSEFESMRPNLYRPPHNRNLRQADGIQIIGFVRLPPASLRSFHLALDAAGGTP